MASGASLIAQLVKNLPAVQETRVPFLGWEDPPEKEMATHSSILAWRIPRTEEPGGLQSTGSQESDTTQKLNHYHYLVISSGLYCVCVLFCLLYFASCGLSQKIQGFCLPWKNLSQPSLSLVVSLSIISLCILNIVFKFSVSVCCVCTAFPQFFILVNQLFSFVSGLFFCLSVES